MSTATDLAFILKRPFAEQVAFFRGKLRKHVPTETWRDLWKAEHDRAFMVAGAAKADLLADLAAAVQAAIESGESIEQFRARFGDIVQKRGWQGWTGEGTQAGTNWRTRIIYRTNMATSYAAGRYAQLQDFPLWVYRHSGAEHPRLQHKAWDGLTLPKDHPFWQTHYPPNGWGCGCRVLGARNERGAARVGGTHTGPPAGWDALSQDTSEPEGIDEGWGYAPGATRADGLRHFVCEMTDALPVVEPANIPHALADMPAPRPFTNSMLLPDGLTDEEYITAFLEEFGASIGNPVVIEDVTGEGLVISEELFIDRRKSKKEGRRVYKVGKDGKRHRYVKLLAQTIKRPQEIFESAVTMKDTGKMEVRRRFLVQWYNVDEVDRVEFGLSSFEFLRRGRLWAGKTTFAPRDNSQRTARDYMQSQRTGNKVWTGQ